MKYSETEVIGSELPIEKEKGEYKYFEEVVGSGIYQQVAWEKTKQIISLYTVTTQKNCQS